MCIHLQNIVQLNLANKRESVDFYSLKIPNRRLSGSHLQQFWYVLLNELFLYNETYLMIWY